jgi:ATP-dependent DNA ligase
MAFMSLEFIKLQLATAIDHPPPRAGWIHEVKHDGYRTLLIIERHKWEGSPRLLFKLVSEAPHLDARFRASLTEG